MHLTDEELEDLAAGELAAQERRRLRLHLAECDVCAARLRAIELADRRIAERLSWLDHPVPVVDAETLMARARRSRPRPAALAAGLAGLLVAAAAAAAVIPGFPVQRLVERAISEWKGDPSPAPEAAPEDATPPLQSGVSFAPAPELEIAFVAAQSEGALRISLADASEVQVREVGGTSAYALDPAELVIDNRSGAGRYEILLPRSLRRVRIRIGDRVVFEKDGPAISARGSVDAGGSHVVPFAPELQRDP